MKIEYEATFPDIDKGEMRAKLKKLKAKLAKPEFMQKRVVFNIPKGHEIKGGWLRVRDEGDKTTMSLKIVDGDKIQDQREICIKVDDFDEAALLLETIGCERKSFQETKRELWILGNCEVTIDEWPFLEPLVEIEGKSENDVKEVCKKLGFDYKRALFCPITKLYNMKYGLSEDTINNYTPEIVFEGKNPFIK